MYDPSYFVEREQYIARVQEFVDQNFEGKLHEVFSEVVDFYSEIVDLARAYQTCLDEREKKNIVKRHDYLAKTLGKYLDVMKKTMDEQGVKKLEGEFCDYEDGEFKLKLFPN